MSVPNPGDEFLARVGLGSMEPEMRASFLAYMFEWVQNEIGDRLTEGLSEEQVKEFEAIMGGDTAVVDNWIAENAPDYREDERYSRMKRSFENADDATLRKEYASSRWIEVVRPDFKDVTTAVWLDVESTIRQNRDEILAASIEPEEKQPE
ncbi:DUF5663 domain-containing protein [Actinomycetaceae bacterium L2_0104]